MWSPRLGASDLGASLGCLDLQNADGCCARALKRKCVRKSTNIHWTGELKRTHKGKLCMADCSCGNSLLCSGSELKTGPAVRGLNSDSESPKTRNDRFVPLGHCIPLMGIHRVAR